MENIVNEPALKYNYLTSEEYLKGERKSAVKHELHQGTIFAITGASLAHNSLVTNIIVNAGAHIKGKGCSIYPSDLRLKTPGIDTFTYPDAMIICGEPETIDNAFDTIKNPSVIFEVSSPSTIDYDRGNKFFYYMQIPSLKNTLLLILKKCMCRLPVNKMMDHGCLKRSFLLIYFYRLKQLNTTFC